MLVRIYHFYDDNEGIAIRYGGREVQKDTYENVKHLKHNNVYIDR